MANKQKLQKNVTKKPQGEKTQRTVHIVKHFQPNVVYNKLHRNCDLPEINADVDSLNKIKKSIVSQTFSNENKKNRITSHLKPNIPSKNERKSSKALDSLSTPLLHKLNTANILKSNTKHSLTSNSSTTKEYVPLKLNKTAGADGLRPTDKQNNLRKPLLKSSSTISSTSNKENYSTKAKTFQTNKSKSFSVSVTKKDKIEPKPKLISVGDTNEKVEDLKKEIRANQLQKYGSYVRGNNNLSSRSERVRSLRDEIQKLINTKVDDKRKHLTELTTEIAEFRTNKNFLIYNVDTQTNKNNKPVDKIQEMVSLNDEETVDVPEDVVSKNESLMKSSEKFCGMPVEAPEVEDHQIPAEHELGTTNNKDVG